MAKNSNIVFTKSIDSYGIKITNSYSDFDLIGKRFNSSPLVYFYNTNTKAIFDYSNTIDQDDLDLLEIFLQGITNGNTFTVSSAYYVKDQDGITSNINGVYQFDGSTGNNLILTTVVSATALNAAEYRYERDYFVDVPQLDLNTGFTGDIAYVIRSVTNSGIIETLGLYENDLVEISYTGNTANLGRYEVEKVETSTDGEELIFVKQPLVADSRIGQQTTINVYNRGNASAEYLNKDKTLNGSARTYSQNGEYLDCFENQNELQAFLRRYGYSQTEVTSVWGYGSDCSGASITEATNGSGILYDKLVSVTVSASNINRKFIINDIVAPTLYVSIGTNYCFFQSHISNYSLSNPHQIVFTRVKNNVSSSNLLSNFYTTFGTPGTNGSYTILNVGASLPTTFYYECLNHPGMGGVVRIMGNTSKSGTTTSEPLFLTNATSITNILSAVNYS